MLTENNQMDDESNQNSNNKEKVENLLITLNTLIMIYNQNELINKSVKEFFFDYNTDIHMLDGALFEEDM